MKKKIYCYGLDLHTYVKTLIANPPEGYEFVVIQNKNKISVINNLKKSRFMIFIYKDLFKKLFNVFKIINKIYYKPSSQDIDLIFSHGQLVYEKKPWVVEILDSPVCFAGNDAKLFNRNLREIERILELNYCKKIIVHLPDTKKEFENYFSNKVIEKIEILPPAIPENKIKKPKKKNKDVYFLFMGSINNPRDFFHKGGLYALESFRRLSKKFENIHLNMRCNVPKKIKEKYNQENITFLEKKLSTGEIKNLYLNSDIMLCSGHFYFLMLNLESLSFGLPIIALDVYGVNNFVENNKNGFLIKPSEKIQYPKKSGPYSNARSRGFINSLKKIDNRIIDEICEKAALLIKDEKLREKFSKEGKRMSETKFSLEKRNKKLKEIFDEAYSK